MNKTINLEECDRSNTTTRGVFTLYQTFASKTREPLPCSLKRKKYCLLSPILF